MGTTQQDGGTKKLKRSGKEHHLPARPSKTDTALEVSELFATTAKHVADVAGVPGLGQAADIVVSILSRIQDMRDNKDEFKQLAQEARELVVSIRDAFTLALEDASAEQKEPVKKRIQELDKDIQGLIGTLNKINDFALVKAKRNWFWRFIYSRYDIQTIRQYRDAMRHSHTTFSSRTNVVLRVDMANVHYKTDQILEAVKRLEQQNVVSTPRERSISSSSELYSGSPPRHPQRQSLNPVVQNAYSSNGPVTVHTNIDNSVHNNSRVHNGDNFTTNTVNYAGGTFLGGSPMQFSPETRSRSSSPQSFGGRQGSPGRNAYHNGPVQYSQQYFNGPAQFNFDQRGYGYEPPQYGHPPHNQQWVDERSYG